MKMFLLKKKKFLLKKTAKEHYFSNNFRKKLTNHALSFAYLDQKHNFLEILEKIFEKFWWKFFRKIEVLFFIFIV